MPLQMFSYSFIRLLLHSLSLLYKCMLSSSYVLGFIVNSTDRKRNMTSSLPSRILQPSWRDKHENNSVGIRTGMEIGTKDRSDIKKTMQGIGGWPRQVSTEEEALEPGPQEGGGIFQVGASEGISGRGNSQCKGTEV